MNEYKYIIEKLDELLEITHRIDKKNTEQDVEIANLTLSCKDHNNRIIPLETKAAQLTGAIRIIVLLCTGGLIGIALKLFL